MANATAVSREAINAVASYCHIDLLKYNYSLYRALLASCNTLNGQRSAQALVVGFAGATYWMCGTLFAKLVSRFTNWWSWYPWMILVSTLGTVIITSAHILNHFGDAPTLSLGLEATGWILMVTGFGLVLHSRLHILITRKAVLRTCLGIIIFDALACHPPVIIASAINGPHKEKLLRAGFCLDVLFVLQENGLAILYIHSFLRFVGGWSSETDIEAKTILKKLVFAELVVFCTDIVPLSLLYAEAYVPREAIHPFCYAIKLTIEFLILNDLVRYSRARQAATQAAFTTSSILGLHEHGNQRAIQEKDVMEGLSFSIRRRGSLDIEASP